MGLSLQQAHPQAEPSQARQSCAAGGFPSAAAKPAKLTHLTRPVSRPSLVTRPSIRLPRLVTRLAPNSYVPIGILTTCNKRGAAGGRKASQAGQALALGQH